ncbi:MAG: GTP cyclohydrolase I FolE [Bdellovibrionaceae bacterium]|nr:GTP cyclohydrolase I FolE [Pseudobdellovibrionaceae bacterium]
MGYKIENEDKEIECTSLVKDNTEMNIKKEILSHVLPSPHQDSELSSEEKVEKIKFHFTEIMKTLGLDLSDDSLKDTPKRVAKMYVNEIFKGLNTANFPKITTIENKMQYDQMIAVKNIDLISYCEHHFQTIQGHATIAYIPSKKVIGLSKINRIVDFFSRRPQVQERLTKQIADCLEYVLETPHVAVYINAKHFCVIARGIEDANSTTITTDLRGDFKTRAETRKEFLQNCN